MFSFHAQGGRAETQDGAGEAPACPRRARKGQERVAVCQDSSSRKRSLPDYKSRRPGWLTRKLAARPKTPRKRGPVAASASTEAHDRTGFVIVRSRLHALHNPERSQLAGVLLADERPLWWPIRSRTRSRRRIDRRPFRFHRRDRSRTRTRPVDARRTDLGLLAPPAGEPRAADVFRRGRRVDRRCARV